MIPRTGAYHDLSQNPRSYNFMMDEGNSALFPNTNNGMEPSLDRRFRTENYLPGDGLPMQADGETTVMRLRLNDGQTPYVVPITRTEFVEGVPTQVTHVASDWKLIVDPDDAAFFRWDPE
jgi:hypothetical protein